MNKLLTLVVLAVAFLSACGSQVSEEVSNLSDDSSNSEAAFYPPGGMGDVVQYETLESPFKLPVRYRSLDEVTVQVYKVDKESFYKNTVGGFAAFEGHLNISDFKEATSLYDAKAKIYPDPGGKEEDGMPLGYLELPIQEAGYYYMAFSYSENESVQYHILLHIGPKDEFNY